MKDKDFFTISPSESLMQLSSSRKGLTDYEAIKRLKLYGENKLKEVKKKNSFLVFLSQFSDLMVLILIFASAISIGIAIFDKTYSELFDGLIILGIVILNATIGFIQEKKAESSLETLKKMTEPLVKVFRNNELKKINSRELVIGDVISLEAGDIIPADCRLLESVMLRCDESSLTGESIPVNKEAKIILNQNCILADRKNCIYSNSIIVNGRALAVVIATGENTELGKIAGMIIDSKKDITPLQNGIKQMGKVITFIVLVVCFITFLIEILVSPQTPLGAFLTAVAIAVAAIPESLPAVITIIMSLGIARLAKRKAIVKHLHAVETLGSCDIICSDKTGTLTQNKMEVQNVFVDNKIYKPQDVAENKILLEVMILCESAKKTTEGYLGDPTEIAILEFANKLHSVKEDYFKNHYNKIDELPFDSNRKLMSVVYEKNSNINVYTKGAVDEILGICNRVMINGKIHNLTQFYKEQILKANKNMTNNALRVLGFAYKNLEHINLDTKFEDDLIFMGLVGMLDPPRKEVKKAVEKCHKAGIVPIMITGDHKNTALAIAKEVGIANNVTQVLTGEEIDSLSDENFEKIVFSKSVFARVSPENKVRIVETLKKLGKIVAMTGDGVNDAPSIKKANIGIGMGITGTDVTKEVADLIITDDNFATIIVAVEEGRKIYTNIQKTVQFLFSANLAELTAIFLATVFMPELIFLTPVQILFVNLISDTLPAIALGLEPAEKNIMDKKPRKKSANLFSDGIGKNIIFMGLLQGLIMLSCFMFGYFVLKSPEIATTLAFYALNIIQFFYFISMRTTSFVFKNNITHNKFAVLAVLSCFVFVGLVALTPLSQILGLVNIPIIAWGVIILGCLITFVVSELWKLRKIKLK